VRRPFVVLAVVELALMAATFGVAVALSRTPPPGDGLAADPVAEMIGHAMPAAPSISRLLWGVVPNGLGILLVTGLVVAYVSGLLVLRRRGDAWPAGRTLAWFGGVLVVAWATFGGLGMYSHVLFSAHMVAHMLLSMVAPILLVLGAPVTLALRTLPGARVPGELGPRQVLLEVLHSRVVSVLAHPLVAAVLFVGSLYAIYFSGLLTVLMSTDLGHAAMTLHFLAVGSLFFFVLVGVDPGPRTVAPLWRFGLLLVVMPFHAFFSVALMSTNTVLGEAYWRSLQRPYATDLLADQTLGGSLSWALGEVPIIIVMVAVFVQWTRSDARDARRGDRSSARVTAAGGDDDLEHYNAYLTRLAGPGGDGRNEQTRQS
jgi:putative copper resistance protein D